MKAEVLTPWGMLNGANNPQLSIDYNLSGWSDTTGQDAANLTPDPNLYIIEIECDQTTLTAILADSKYHVLWHE